MVIEVINELRLELLILDEPFDLVIRVARDIKKTRLSLNFNGLMWVTLSKNR